MVRRNFFTLPLLQSRWDRRGGGRGRRGGRCQDFSPSPNQLLLLFSFSPSFLIPVLSPITFWLQERRRAGGTSTFIMSAAVLFRRRGKGRGRRGKGPFCCKGGRHRNKNKSPMKNNIFASSCKRVRLMQCLTFFPTLPFCCIAGESSAAKGKAKAVSAATDA